jgi:hypothetical protein
VTPSYLLSTYRLFCFSFSFWSVHDMSVCSYAQPTKLNCGAVLCFSVICLPAAAASCEDGRVLYSISFKPLNSASKSHERSSRCLLVHLWQGRPYVVPVAVAYLLASRMHEPSQESSSSSSCSKEKGNVVDLLSHVSSFFYLCLSPI